MTSRGWTKLILVVGLGASVATSRASWMETGDANISAVAVPANTTTVRFAIVIALEGPAATADDTYGNIDAKIEITTSSPPPGNYLPRVTLTSLTNPDEHPYVQAMLDADGVLRANPAEPAWLSCTTSPCVEEFELLVEIPASPMIVQSVGAFITASAGGNAVDAPAGTDVVVTIEGPLP